MSSEETIKSSVCAADNIVVPTLDLEMIQQIENIMGVEMTLQLVQQFLAYVPQQLTALQQSIVASDTETLRQQAHQFKGESLQIGANSLGALCKELETFAQESQIEAASASLVKLETEWEQVKVDLSQVGHYD